MARAWLTPGAMFGVHIVEFGPPLIATVVYALLHGHRARTLAGEGPSIATWRVVSFAVGRQALLDLAAERGIELSDERATRAARAGAHERMREQRMRERLMRMAPEAAGCESTSMRPGGSP